LLATIGVLAAAVATIAVTIAGAFWREGSFDRVETERQRVNLLHEARASALTEGSVLAGYLLMQDETLRETLEQSGRSVTDSLETLVGLESRSSDEQATIDALIVKHEALTESYKDLLAAIDAGDIELALEIATERDIQGGANEFFDELAGVTADAEAQLAAERSASRTGLLYWDWATMALVALLTVIVVICGFAVQNGVARPIAAVAAATRAIAGGNFTARAKPGGPSDVIGLANDVNAMTDALIARSEELSAYLSKDLEQRTIALEESNRRLAEAEERTRAVIANALDAVITIDSSGAITEWSPQAEVTFGWPKAEVIGRPVEEIIMPERYRAAHRRGLAHYLATGEGQFLNRRIEISALRRDGAEFPIELAISPLDQRGVRSFSAFARDITERKAAEETLRERTSRDPLTGVLNHGAIVEQLRNAIGTQPDVNLRAIIMADVDGLKAVNDVHGHLVGDQVLVEAAGALKQTGAIVGRYGGDEFVVLLTDAYPSPPQDYVEGALARLAAVEVRDPATNAHVAVSLSLGVALYPEEAGAAKSLLEISDSAMYAMKRQRPAQQGGTAPTLGTDLAAELVGQMVPLLTAPGTADEKLELVSHRLSDIAGYDAVNVTMFATVPTATGPRAANTFAKAPKHLVEAWNADQRSGSADDEVNPVRALLEKAKRPLIFDDPWHDERFTQQQRDILRAAEMRSVLVAPFIWKDEVIGFIGVASKQERAFGAFEGQFLASVATHVTAIVQMATLVTELETSQSDLQTAREETVLLLAASAEAHDTTTGQHLSNVRRVAELLASSLGFDEEQTKEIGLAATLHDIGKVNVPGTILAKSGELDSTEWDEMRSHTLRGFEFLNGRRGFELAAAVARSHHERWDGTGYPEGLQGTEIPLAAAIASVADAFDAMTSARPYKAARSFEEARAEIAAGSGYQFSPAVVNAFMDLCERGLIQQSVADHDHAAAA
jgi:diguanylate cyclase (GGDEF)-like protein/PAS domain S-box-containing protein